MDPNKNKLIIPEPTPQVSGCPSCNKSDYSGRMHGGVLVRKCRACGNEWAGGLPQMPQDPRIPTPHDPYVPTVGFGKNSKGESVELRRRPDTTQDFRKGARIPEGDE